jgi:CRP/FNR family transcriptional regulator
MAAHFKIKPVPSAPFQARTLCAACPSYDLSLCQAVSKSAESGPLRAEYAQLQQTHHSVPARRIICYERDLNDVVPIIGEGWAASVVMLANGSRQILSFLLPGDITSTALLFGPRSHCLVEAITEVSYCTFKRTALTALLFGDPDLFDVLSRTWIEEKSRADQLTVDLGRRTADERIARLILNLMDRLTRRGMAKGQTMEFPLRQHHIADATGLTPVHVSKVLSEFRRRGLIEISDRSLTMIDPDGFRRVADLR